MRAPTRRTTAYLAVLTGSIGLFGVLYWRGMAVYEGEQLSLLHSVRVVVETYTTTGYGSDAPWESTEMNLFVMAMNTVGTVMIFLALPVFLSPILRDALERTPPTSLEADPTDHVVLAAYTHRLELLADELEDQGIDYVIVEPDEERAMGLDRDDEPVIHGNPDELASLEAARLRAARGIVVDAEDQSGASVVLTAREIDEDVRVVSVVDAADRAPYHRLAGADAVISPGPMLGKRIAEMATAAIRTELGLTQPFGDWSVAQLPVSRGSALDGATTESSGLLADDGVLLLGAWRESEFECPPPEDAEFVPGTVLLVVGDDDDVATLADRATGRTLSDPTGETVVVGFGEVGSAVVETVEDWGLPHTVVDLEELPGVDVVGDATDPYTMMQAGVADADALVLAIPGDAETEFATLVGRDCSDELHVAARADDTASERRLHRAGADYVLSVDGVTGRLLGATVLDERPLLATDSRTAVLSIAEPEGADGGLAAAEDDAVAERAAALDGVTVGDADLDLGGRYSVVAVARGDEVHASPDDDVELAAGDDLLLVGSDDALDELIQRFGQFASRGPTGPERSTDA